jgi:imidazolonepropionase-like amidohydrolase
MGSLEPGKLVNLVLLDENPLNDIANAWAVLRVVAGGRVFAEPSRRWIRSRSSDSSLHESARL